jgi:ribonuclease J
MREAEELVEQARAQVVTAIESTRRASPFASTDDDGVDVVPSVNWADVRNRIRDALSKYVYDQTRRRPMILPLIVEI